MILSCFRLGAQVVMVGRVDMINTREREGADQREEGIPFLLMMFMPFTAVGAVCIPGGGAGGVSMFDHVVSASGIDQFFGASRKSSLISHACVRETVKSSCYAPFYHVFYLLLVIFVGVFADF